MPKQSITDQAQAKAREVASKIDLPMNEYWRSTIETLVFIGLCEFGKECLQHTREAITAEDDMERERRLAG